MSVHACVYVAYFKLMPKETGQLTVAFVPVGREASSDGLERDRRGWRLEKQAYDWTLDRLAPRSTGKIWITEKTILTVYS